MRSGENEISKKENFVNSNRRDFIKSSAVFSGLAFVPGSVFGAFTSNKRLKL